MFRNFINIVKNDRVRRFKLLGVLLVFLIIVMVLIFKKADTVQAEKILPKVLTIESKIQTRPISFVSNAVIKAYKDVSITSEIDGLITKVIAQDGQFLKAGAPIIKVDEFNRRNLFEAAKIALDSAKLAFNSISKLQAKQLSSQNAYLQAKANLKQAEADFDAAKKNFEKTTIKAPFDGFIEAIHYKEGDYIAAKSSVAIASFHALAPLKVSFFVSEEKRGLLSDNMEINVRDKFDNQEIAKISYIANEANSNTRTFAIDAILENKANKFRIGQSVAALINSSNLFNMHYIPKSALILDENGAISVKYINHTDNTVLSQKIVILDEDENGFWINGLDIDVATIITQGAAFINEKEKVQF